MTIRFNSTLSSCLISLLLIGGSTASAQTNKSVLQDIGIEGMKAEGWMKEALTTQRNGFLSTRKVGETPPERRWIAGKISSRPATGQTVHCGVVISLTIRS